jgi:hypothetical protein
MGDEGKGTTAQVILEAIRETDDLILKVWSDDDEEGNAKLMDPVLLTQRGHLVDALRVMAEGEAASRIHKIVYPPKEEQP